jgi:CheY-like chemotaxis protein
MQSGLRILAVDDEPSVSLSLRFVLERPGRRFTSACDGQEALGKIAAESFDLVITDNNMPKVDGLELVRRLREQKFGGKIVVLSAHLSQEKMQAYTDLAVDQMLHKPFDVHALSRAIDEVAAAA